MLLAIKLTEKIPDCRSAKENYQTFVRKKNTKSVKQSKIITHTPKTFENPNIVDTKSVITKHPKIWHKLPKTIRQSEQVGFNSVSASNDRK